MFRRVSSIVVAAAFLGTAAFAAQPARAGNVSWGVSIGVPGFSMYAGQPAWGWARWPAVRPVGPVVVAAPVVAPPVFVAPPVIVRPPVVVAPPVVWRPVVRPWVRPVPDHRPRPVVVYRPW